MRGLNVAKAFTTEQRKQALIFPKRRRNKAGGYFRKAEMELSDVCADEKPKVSITLLIYQKYHFGQRTK